MSRRPIFKNLIIQVFRIGFLFKIKKAPKEGLVVPKAFGRS